jgi:hypothetical protein
MTGPQVLYPVSADLRDLLFVSLPNALAVADSGLLFQLRVKRLMSHRATARWTAQSSTSGPAGNPTQYGLSI